MYVKMTSPLLCCKLKEIIITSFVMTPSIRIMKHRDLSPPAVSHILLLSLLILMVMIVSSSDDFTLPLPHCVDPSVRLQPCQNNDSYCGDWDIPKRTYRPNNCYYRDFTGEQARKCFGE